MYRNLKAAERLASDHRSRKGTIGNYSVAAGTVRVDDGIRHCKVCDRTKYLKSACSLDECDTNCEFEGEGGRLHLEMSEGGGLGTIEELRREIPSKGKDGRKTRRGSL